MPSSLRHRAHCGNLIDRSRDNVDDSFIYLLTDCSLFFCNHRGAAYDDFPESGWDKIYALNVKAMYYTTVGLDAELKAGATRDQPSSVINIASVAGLQTTDVTTGSEGGLSAPGHGTFSYGPSKAACIHLTKMQASKLMTDHVTVNVICPGAFPSRMTIGMLVESMAGKAGAMHGLAQDATPFQ